MVMPKLAAKPVAEGLTCEGRPGHQATDGQAERCRLQIGSGQCRGEHECIQTALAGQSVAAQPAVDPLVTRITRHRIGIGAAGRVDFGASG